MRCLQRRLRVGAVLALVAVMLFVVVVIEAGAQTAPRLTSNAAVLIDHATGEILFAHHAEEPKYPASTTKLVTLLTVLENYEGSLDDIVTVSAHAASTRPCSCAYITAGQQVSLRELLIAMILMSGNDAAVAVAEHVAGSVEAFAELMNETARRAGATRSHFTNPHGLSDPQHVTTVLDMARITGYAYDRHEFFRYVTSLRQYNFPWLNGTSYLNNAFVAANPGAGGKTGFTNASRNTLVGYLERDGDLMIGVIFDGNGAALVAEEMSALIEYGFARIAAGNLVRAEEVVAHLPVIDGSAEVVPAVAGQLVRHPGVGSRFEQVIEVEGDIAAPVRAGDQLGWLNLFIDGELFRTIPLLAGATVEAASEPIVAAGESSSAWQRVLSVLFWTFAVLLVLAVMSSISRRRRRMIRRRRRRRQLLL